MVTQICIFLDLHYLAYLAPYIIPELMDLYSNNRERYTF